jgi:hypothetical protein
MHRIRAGTTLRELTSIKQGYEFKPKKWDWFSRLLWRLLNKINAVEPHYGEIATFHFTKFHEDKLANYIIQATQENPDLYERPKDYCLIMGRKDFSELIDKEQEMARFSDLGTHRAYPIGYSGSYMSLPIHVVNTMEGFAVVPKMIIER